MLFINDEQIVAILLPPVNRNLNIFHQ